ncbi:FMN-binding negative transcriptional regulator [Labrys portucalensis]|uniref:FMN-binding negative transcriptional regulator n=1 Tax=Labrys neptuniae TaxID=376174 RepID=A0ABV3PVH0_9HYPH
MYNPRYFREERVEVLHALMRDHPLATVVTHERGRLQANHIPLFLVADKGRKGVLRGHLNRNNHMAVDHDPALEVLAIFQGPMHYITPRWYVDKVEGGKAVPTWNYVTVHVHGRLRSTENPRWLREHVTALTNLVEAGRPQPWQAESAPSSFMKGQIKGIIGLEIAITSIEGKWKLSQNRPEPYRSSVIEGLTAEGEAVMADLMAQAVK